MNDNTLKNKASGDSEPEMNIRAVTPDEEKYLYSQSYSLDSYCGCVGHLRGDFDSDGKGFFTSWTDHRGDLKTDEFKQEFDEVVNQLRENDGLLSSRTDMKTYCSQKEDALIGDYSENKYGFRTDTDNYAYLIRCFPQAGDYNFYIYCYKKDWLDMHIKKAEKGIRFINSDYKTLFHIPDGESIIVTREDGEKQIRHCRFVDEYHTEINGNCYHICQFAEIMERNGWTYVPANSILPEHCYATLPTTGEIIIIKKGEKGYYQTHIEGGQKVADQLNERLQVSKAQEAAMVAGSLFGWDSPGADPKNYDLSGMPFPVKSDIKSNAEIKF